MLKVYCFNTRIIKHVFIMFSAMCLRGFHKNIQIVFIISVLRMNLCIILCFSCYSKQLFCFHFGLFETINFVKCSIFLNFSQKFEKLFTSNHRGGHGADPLKTVLLKNDFFKKLLKRYRSRKKCNILGKTQILK